MKTAALLLVIFFVPVALCLSAPGRLANIEPDPCATARSITEAPPCRTPHDCEAVDLWNQNFGMPQYVPTKPGQEGRLPQELLSRLPKGDFTLQKDEPLGALLKRLTAASNGVDLMVDQGIEGTYRGEPGTVSLADAWQRVATSAGLAIRAEGSIVFVTTPERAAQLSLRRPRMFNCPAR
jgi:hypothetical protein